MEVFGFQQSMTHCSEFVGCLSHYFFGRKRTCVFTPVPDGSLEGCPRPSNPNSFASFQNWRYQEMKFSLGSLWFDPLVGLDPSSRGGKHERALGQPERGEAGGCPRL